MSRYIDADALNVPHFHLATDRIKVLDMIDEAPTIDAVSEWIPCEERLPNEGEDVLAWVETEHDARVACCNYACGKWFDAIMDVTIEPIAWMPLPKPYERSDT